MKMLFTVLVGLCLVTPLNAQTRVFFSGRVGETPDELQSQFQPGMQMSGSYTVDPSLSTEGLISSISDFEMTIGDYRVQKPVGGVRGDITISDSEFVAVAFAEGEPVVGGHLPAIMALQLHSEVGLEDLDSPVPSLDLFDRPEWTLDFSQFDLRVSGSVDSLAVPEPSSLVLIVMAGMCLAQARRRRLHC